jgi:hypothetical protein
MNKRSNLFKNFTGKALNAAYDLPQSVAKTLADKSLRDPAFAKNLEKVLNFRVMDPSNQKTIRNFFEQSGRYGGAGAGALGGFSLDSDTKSDKLRNTLLGAAGGFFGGARAGRQLGVVAPSLAQKAFGRVATNVYMPFGYDMNLAKDVAREAVQNNSKANPLVAMFNSIVKDKPLYSVEPEALGREFLYRKMYGLKPRFGSESYFVPAGKNKHWTYNKGNEFAKKELDELQTAWADLAPGNKNVSISDYTANIPQLIKDKGYVGSGITPGFFWVNNKGRFTDPWDFALHEGQKLDNPTNILRSVAHMFSDPHVVTAQLPSARNIIKNIPKGLLSDKKIQNTLDDALISNLNRQYNVEPAAIKNLGILNINPEKKLGLVTGYMDSDRFKGLEHLAKMHGFSAEDMLTLLR